MVQLLKNAGRPPQEPVRGLKLTKFGPAIAPGVRVAQGRVRGRRSICAGVARAASAGGKVKLLLDLIATLVDQPDAPRGSGGRLADEQNLVARLIALFQVRLRLGRLRHVGGAATRVARHRHRPRSWTSVPHSQRPQGVFPGRPEPPELPSAAGDAGAAAHVALLQRARRTSSGREVREDLQVCPRHHQGAQEASDLHDLCLNLFLAAARATDCCTLESLATILDAGAVRALPRRRLVSPAGRASRAALRRCSPSTSRTCPTQGATRLRPPDRGRHRVDAQLHDDNFDPWRARPRSTLKLLKVRTHRMPSWRDAVHAHAARGGRNRTSARSSVSHLFWSRRLASGGGQSGTGRRCSTACSAR